MAGHLRIHLTFTGQLKIELTQVLGDPSRAQKEFLAKERDLLANMAQLSEVRL